MIKSEITKKEEFFKPFPKLMANNKNGIVIILAISMDVNKYEGIVIYSENNDYCIGYHSCQYIDFKDYNGTITLSNLQ